MDSKNFQYKDEQNNQREKIKQKADNLEALVSNIQHFNDTNDLNLFKEFIRQNRENLIYKMEEIYRFKSIVDDQKKINDELRSQYHQCQEKGNFLNDNQRLEFDDLQKENQLNQKLIAQLEQIQNGNQSKEKKMQNMTQLQQTVSNLEQDIKNLEQKNTVFQQNFRQRAFFNEYDKMCTELYALQNAQVEDTQKIQQITEQIEVLREQKNINH